ncbi:hypothetical protein M441DRAFT_58196 [Trichoderma asperellum CBS 433.97]|uniref:Secreted protein n=1 Tax=Trichoderma asperellum (strain ATCC 204424 / CBS 433.97 / NBRC 101777) TaxID=1042311 RepID=A0A2T3Z7E9_TRIA4|nr:hypothetical protein M441DRAFT_58196 [Trichoderma asperellum CBS 433.97]PTB40712.1 hypothetical protein M441DRAFT_58196 [Trichoderma asperellum CBS 433.97]
MRLSSSLLPLLLLLLLLPHPISQRASRRYLQVCLLHMMCKYVNPIRHLCSFAPRTAEEKNWLQPRDRFPQSCLYPAQAQKLAERDARRGVLYRPSQPDLPLLYKATGHSVNELAV